MTRHDIGAIALLACACLVFFGPAVFGERAVFTWNMDLWHPWRAIASADDLARPTRAADCARQFYVMREISSEATREGRVPLWNRWIYAGTPFLANFQPGVFYPPNVLLAWSGLGVADQMTAFVTFHFFVAAAGAYVLLRLFAASPLASLLGAVVFAFSTIQVVRIGITTMPATGAWLPWALAASRRWFARPDARAWIGMVGALGLSGLAGHFQIFVFTGYAWALFGLLQGWRRNLGDARRRISPARCWIGWAAAGVVAVLLMAVHLVPTLEFVPLSQEAENSRDEMVSGTLHPWVLGKMVVPGLLGDPVDHNNATHFLRVGNGFYFQTEHSTAVYLGILPLLLAGALLFNPGDGRREAAFALLLASGAILFCLPTPVLDLGRFLPGMDFSRPDRATFLYGAGLGLAAGLGAERLASREGPGGTRPSNRFAVLVGVAALGFALVVAFFGERILPGRIAQALGPGYLPRAGAVAALIAALSLALVALRARGAIGRNAFAVIALVLVAADTGWTSGRMNVLQPKESIFRPATQTESITFLLEKRDEAGPFRIMRYEPRHDQFEGVFPGSTPTIYGIEDVLGFDSLNTQWYEHVIDAIDPSIILNRGNFKGARDPRALASPILDLLGARYILALGDGPLPGLTVVHRSELTIHENPDALPRAFLVDDVRVAESEDAVLRAMADPSFRPGQWAYAERPVEGLMPGPGAPDSIPPGDARVVSSRDEEVTVRVDARRRALLVVSDAWYPGWRARVDGASQPILRVDHAFRGVVVEPGMHDVVFTYAPDSFRLGAALSLAGLSTLGAGAFFFRRKD